MTRIVWAIFYFGLLASLSACSDHNASESQNSDDGNAYIAYTPKDINPETMQSWPEFTKETLRKARESKGHGHTLLWQYQNDDTTVYLYGSIHYLSSSVEWRTPELDEAFESADTVVFEVDFSDEDLLTKQAAVPLGWSTIRSDQRLDDFLTETQREIVMDFFADEEVNYWGLQKLNPWLVNDLVLASAGEDMDAYLEYGVEAILSAEAELNDTKMDGLETIEERMIAAEVPMFEEVESLIRSIMVYDLLVESTEVLTDEWLNGDMNGIDLIMQDPGLLGSGGGYEGLIGIRNRNWIDDIKKYLERPGVTFIVVGSGHLVGKDSLFNLLEKEGYRFEQIQ